MCHVLKKEGCYMITQNKKSKEKKQGEKEECEKTCWDILLYGLYSNTNSGNF